MSAISDDIVNYFKGTGLLNDFAFQYGEWVDGDKPYYFVIIPDSGMAVMPWMRSPNYRCLLIGPKAKRPYSSGGVGNSAEDLMTYMRDNQSSELHQYIETTEPSQPIQTESDRYMITFSLMTKLAV